MFKSNDEGVAKVTPEGRVTATRPGDTSLVATFGGHVLSCHVLVPRPSDGQRFPEFPAENKIDQFVVQKLRKLNIRPSALATDDVFLRRVYLDLIGTLPTTQEASRFLKDETPDKRSRLIDELLHRPEYAMFWANKFCDWTGNETRMGYPPSFKTSFMWFQWLQDKLQKNQPYDEIVRGYLTASSREGRSREDWLNAVKTIKEKISQEKAPKI